MSISNQRKIRKKQEQKATKWNGYDSNESYKHGWPFMDNFRAFRYKSVILTKNSNYSTKNHFLKSLHQIQAAILQTTNIFCVLGLKKFPSKGKLFAFVSYFLEEIHSFQNPCGKNNFPCQFCKSMQGLSHCVKRKRDRLFYTQFKQELVFKAQKITIKSLQCAKF